MSNVQIDDSNSTSTCQYQQTPPRLLSGRYPRGMQQNAYELMIYRWPDPRDDMDPDTAYRINRWLVNKNSQENQKNYKTQENQKKTSSKTLENPKTKSTSLLSFLECQPFHHSKVTNFFFSSDHFVKGSPSYIFDHHRTTVHVKTLISEQSTFLQLTNSWHEVNDRDPSGHADLLVVHRLPSGQLLPRQRYDLVQFWFG